MIGVLDSVLGVGAYIRRRQGGTAVNKTATKTETFFSVFPRKVLA